MTTRYSSLNVDEILILIASFLIVVILVVVAIAPLADEYEMFFNDVYPLYFWVIVCTSLTCGLLVLVHQAFVNKKSNWWLAGLIIVIIVNSLLLLLPTFRGYPIYGRWDVLTHVGYIKDIISTGSIGSLNYYPTSHVLGAELSLILNLNPDFIINIVPVIFNPVYTVGIYLLVKVLTKNHGEALLATAFGGVLLFTYFNNQFMPTFLAFSIIPLILFCLYNAYFSPNSKNGFYILLIIFLILITFFHPLAAINLIIICLFFPLSLFSGNFIKKKINSRNGLQFRVKKDIFAPSIILTISAFTWLSSTVIFNGWIKTIGFWLDALKESSQLVSLALTAKTFSTPLDFLNMLFRDYGHDIIYLILSFIVILFIFKKFLTKKYLGFEEIFLAEIFLIFLFISAAILWGPPFLDPIRYSMWVLLPATLLNGIIIHRWISDKKKYELNVRKILLGIVVILIISSGIIGVFSVHSSAIMDSGMNSQVTNTELEGMSWHLEYRNPELISYSYLNEIEWFLSPLIGVAQANDTFSTFSQAAAHFDFPPNTTGYLIINSYLKDRFTIWMPTGTDITSKDFLKLVNNTQFCKLFDNSGLDIYSIR